MRYRKNLVRPAIKPVLVPLLSFIVGLLLPVMPSAYADAEESAPAWFSDGPPSGQWAKRSRFAHGGPVERGRGGKYHKRLWYREGIPLNEATYPKAYPSASNEVVVFDPKGTPVAYESFEADEGHGIIFPMPEEGFYNTYLVTRQVGQGILRTDIAKMEALKHSCGEGHDREFTESRMLPLSGADIPFEIIRQRVPDEDFHTRLTAGDNVFFQVLYRGKPAAGASVTMSTERGWTRRVTADENGRAYFQLIRDYYPSWQWFNKRQSQSFLVTAHFEVQENGSFEGEAFDTVRYNASLPGHYFPSSRDYESYLYGLIVMLVAFALAGGGVYFYRLRRIRPSREKFDETA